MSKNPVLIPQPFATNGSKNNIQNTRQTGQDPEDATWSDGFPNVTMQPIESGGLPPKGMDFNGILNALSATIVHMQKGNLFYFDKAYCDAFGGYQKGAILQADDGTKIYVSVADKNTNNPNQNPKYWEVIAGIGLNAATASKLFEGRNIGGVFFDGTQDIDLPGVNTRGNQDTTGNASTATYAGQIAARKIGGVTFNAKSDIDLPGVNKPGNQNTTGNAATASKLSSPCNIGGMAFDGSQDIHLPVSSGYLPTEKYEAGDLVKIDGEWYECYHPDGCKGKDPRNPIYRPSGWQNTDQTKPYYWLKIGRWLSFPETGSAIYLPTTTIREGLIKYRNDGNLHKNKFWRLAMLYPDLLTNNVINIADLRGVFLRSLDDGRGIDNLRNINSIQSHSIQGHSHYLPTSTTAGGGGWGVSDNNWVWCSPNKIPSNRNNEPAKTFKEDGYGDEGNWADETRPVNIAMLIATRI